MWFAVRTKSRHETLVARYLEARGIERFLPVYQARRQWSDRMKLVQLPLFCGYVFIRIDEGCAFTPALEAPGAVEIISFGGVPASIPDEEIRAVRRLVASGLPACPHPYLKQGDRVRINAGPLAELEGILQKIRNQYRFVLTVDMLQRAVSVEVDSELVEPVRKSSHGRLEPKKPNAEYPIV
jgi:transcription antitermination factor NusG